jgi:hypothetical protein
MGVRKIAILAPKIAVTFAGSAATACLYIAKLRSFVADGLPTLEEFADYLGALDAASGEAYCEIIGWLGAKEGNFACFEWKSDRPDKIAWGLEAFTGSGAPPFRAILKGFQSDPRYEEVRPDGLLTTILGACLEAESNYGTFSSVSTGIWFEAACFDPQRGFVYMSPVNCFWLDLSDPRKSNNAKFDRQVRYEARDQFTVISTMWPSSGTRSKTASVEILNDIDRKISGLEEIGDHEQYFLSVTDRGEGVSNWIWLLKFAQDDGGNRTIGLGSYGEHDLVRFDKENALSAQIKLGRIFAEYWVGWQLPDAPQPLVPKWAAARASV